MPAAGRDSSRRLAPRASRELVVLIKEERRSAERAAFFREPVRRAKVAALVAPLLATVALRSAAMVCRSLAAAVIPSRAAAERPLAATLGCPLVGAAQPRAASRVRHPQAVAEYPVALVSQVRAAEAAPRAQSRLRRTTCRARTLRSLVRTSESAAAADSSATTRSGVVRAVATLAHPYIPLRPRSAAATCSAPTPRVTSATAKAASGAASHPVVQPASPPRAGHAAQSPGSARTALRARACASAALGSVTESSAPLLLRGTNERSA